MAPNHTSYLGPYVHLSGLTTAQLPPRDASGAKLAPLVTSILQEAVPFIDSAAPRSTHPSSPTSLGPRESDSSASTSSLWKSKGRKSSEVGEIELRERVIPVKDLKIALEKARHDGTQATSSSLKSPTGKKMTSGPETWACRVSQHQDLSTANTASYAEFEEYMRDQHAEAEVAFTPDVLEHHDAIVFENANEIEPMELGGWRWGRFGMRVVEMKHKLPPPLGKRVFVVLQVHATVTHPPGVNQGDDEFIVVSIPISDFATVSKDAKLSKDSSVTIGAYVSIERVRKLPSHRLEWVMATASDAGGRLPMFVQTRAIPGQIAKDVGLFINWRAEERRGRQNGDEGTTATAAAQTATPASAPATGGLGIASGIVAPAGGVPSATGADLEARTGVETQPAV